MSLKVEMASVSDRDDLVAEIWQEDEMVAEIQRAPDGRFVLELYPSPNQQPWSLDLECWMAALSEAKRRLV
ncbi:MULTISPECIES: hypothetical protein [Pseudomonadaceae]|uniref:hypothetical protein n=1 Tax=Pseudomonadaceae TaxID=135621 RepID=UPI00187A4152|nr:MULTISPECIES: hypothetical protein [Pseudomonadaceae]MBE7373547.1 hypothetical protein [Pseudomonas lopnurensis]